MGLNSLTLDLPVITSLDLSMLGIQNLTLTCNKLIYANLRGSYKQESSVRVGGGVCFVASLLCCCCRCWMCDWLWSGVTPPLLPPRVAR